MEATWFFQECVENDLPIGSYSYITTSCKWEILIGFRARRQNIAYSIVCSYSDPGISEKRKETEIFIERFFSRTKKL